MADKIIKTKTLESGITAICCETMQDNFSIEIAAETIFLHSTDIPKLVSLLYEVDKHFLKKCDDGERLPGGFL